MKSLTVKGHYGTLEHVQDHKWPPRFSKVTPGLIELTDCDRLEVDNVLIKGPYLVRIVSPDELGTDE